ncbi:MAG TPA: siphovirus Gp157 family protein [Candidatus Acidoferrum sp.]
MTKRLDPIFVQQEIAQLLLDHPELEEDEVFRADMIEGSTAAPEFLSEVVQRIEAARVVGAGIKLYIADLKERADRMERRQDALRGLAFRVMQTAQLSKLELPEATLSVRAGQRKVIVLNEAEIDDTLMRIKKEPNKTLIKELLLAGNEVGGCVLSNAEPVLAIRVK